MDIEISVLLITQCPSTQKILSQIINAHRAIKMIGNTCTKEMGIQYTLQHVPDVILIDFGAEDSLSNYEIIRCLHKISPVSKIIILAESLDVKAIFKALKIGAVSCINNYRSERDADVIGIILEVAQYRIPILPDIANCIIEDLHGSLNSDFSFYSPLSCQELELLHLINKNSTVEHITRKLSVTRKHIHKVTYNIIQKLHAENMNQNSPADWGFNW